MSRHGVDKILCNLSSIMVFKIKRTILLKKRKMTKKIEIQKNPIEASQNNNMKRTQKIRSIQS